MTKRLIIDDFGNKQWYLNGNAVNEEEFNACELDQAVKGSTTSKSFKKIKI